MKLKKIASLALAGIMAVSMLAACGEGTGSSSGNSDSNVVTPVDNSLAAYLNSELTDEEKAVITFSSDTSVQAALEKVAATIPDGDMGATAGSTWYSGSVVEAFREAVDAKANYGISYWFEEDRKNTDDVTAASMLIIPAFNADDAMKEAVLEKLQDVIKSNMPSGDWTKGEYRYTYTGKIAVTKVTSGNDKNIAYVVGIVIDMTATKLA